MFKLLIFLVAVELLSLSSAAGVTCENVKNYTWIEPYETQLTCFMERSTLIDSRNFWISSDRNESVIGFHCNGNHKIQFLPNDFAEKLPNVIIYNAGDCSIKAISQRNFRGLNKLRALNLVYNKIQTIDDNTFDGLTELEVIWLWKNRINSINGAAFASLSKLTKLHLNSNVCINEDFLTEARIAEMRISLTAKCDAGNKSNEEKPNRSDEVIEPNTCEEEIERLKSLLDKKTLEASKALARVSKLEDELQKTIEVQRNLTLKVERLENELNLTKQ